MNNTKWFFFPINLSNNPIEQRNLAPLSTDVETKVQACKV